MTTSPRTRRVALVFGGSRGIGAGIAQRLASDGFDVALTYVSRPDAAEAVVAAIQAAVAQMRDGGRVVTIGSNTAIRTGTPGSSVYAMTKAAVASMAQNLALDLAPRGITINNVQPGPVETDMTAPFADYLKDKLPMGRMGRPGEIGALVSFLAGPESGYMTGTSLTIDGGYML